MAVIPKEVMKIHQMGNWEMLGDLVEPSKPSQPVFIKFL